MLKKTISFILLQDIISILSIFITAFSIIIFLFIFFTNRHKVPDQLPLFYSLNWGDPYLANQTQFLLLPFLMLLTLLINLILSWHLHQTQIVLKRMLNLASATSAILLLITGIKIIYIFI